MAEEVLKEGFLMKQGGSIKTWKRRWFVLKGTTIYYYKDPSKAKPKGMIPIVSPEGAAYDVTVNTTKGAAKHFCFQIAAPKRTYLCWANSGNEMDGWINSIIDAQIKAKAKVVDDPLNLAEKNKKKAKGRAKSEVKSSAVEKSKGEGDSPLVATSERPKSEWTRAKQSDEATLTAPTGRPTIVIDNGSGWIKAGYSSQRTPGVRIPTVVSSFGELTVVGDIVLDEEEMKQVAKQLKHRKRNDTGKPEMRIAHPIERGIIQDWDSMESIWEHTFNKLGLKSSGNDYPVLLSEPPLNPKQNTEKMAQIMFEKFAVPDLYIAGQATLSLYSVGKSTGVVLSVGDGVSHVVPIYDGFTIDSAVRRLDLGGNDLTDHMMKLMKQRGYTFNSDLEREVVRDMKEKLSYVALDFDAELKNPNIDRRFNIEESSVKLLQKRKDNIIVVGSERIYCPEALFKPSLVGLEVDGIAQMVYDSVQGCGIDLKRKLYENIVLNGGSTMFNGFAERVEKEVTQLLNSDGKTSNLKPKVFRRGEGSAQPVEDNRQDSVWLGGATLAQLDTFEDMCLAKEDFDELGVSYIHEKFKGI